MNLWTVAGSIAGFGLGGAAGGMIGARAERGQDKLDQAYGTLGGFVLGSFVGSVIGAAVGSGVDAPKQAGQLSAVGFP